LIGRNKVFAVGFQLNKINANNPMVHKILPILI
jgi:hypothetical protein